ncbi:hypothetical protein NQK81_01595 [Amycolatopsis roodepoortensis]|uniref:hypothetical protein n=1 Tax=Amycolatopsis roodepoortensis TaxID=700274 RepID=UPI00214BA095|nr:hypothetical protein [Amycolatopsis roodepoortensis]UUV32169.1 hypothetical protein NQK81_01595 [Amycolatopsis roodepoortensis]
MLTMVVCLPCGGEGSGDVPVKGLTSGSGACRECHGSGEVTPERRKRQELSQTVTVDADAIPADPTGLRFDQQGASVE